MSEATPGEEAAPEQQDAAAGRRGRRPSTPRRAFYRTPKLFAEEVDAGYRKSLPLVLRRLTLEIGEREIVALVGPSVSGKSTLLRTLARALKPRKGVLYLEGKAMREWPVRDVARRLALLPDAAGQAIDLTVLELVRLGRSPHQALLGLPERRDEEAVRRALDQAGIAALADRRLSQLSGSELQRARLAMALAQESEVMLLDEPTAFLDVRGQLEVLDLFRRLNRERGLTVVMTLNDLNHAARFAGRVVVLNEGEIYADGTPAEVLTESVLRDVFGVQVKVMTGADGNELTIVFKGTV